MKRSDLFRALADVALITHVAFVTFVVGGLLLILLGGFRGWNWIRNPWLRVLHLVGIGISDLVPEPSTTLLFGVLSMVGLLRRKR